MYVLYRNAAVAFFVLATFTSLIGYICLDRAFIRDALLPAHTSAIPWQIEAASDGELGGSSSVSVNDATYSLDFDFLFSKNAEDPFIAVTLAFDDFEDPENFVDMTRYSTLTFDVKCAPANVLSLVVPVFDEQVTEPGNFISYRIPTTFFSCKEDWTETQIDLNHLTVPGWWLRLYNIELSDWDYRLDKAAGLSFGVTSQSPVDTDSTVKITDLTLRGQDWRHVYVFVGLTILIWGGFVFWLFKQHRKYLIADITERLQKDRPLVAYQKLSIEPHKDYKKDAVLRFMATEYANPNMSLEMAKSRLGINRSKINEVLKEELGLTFSAYLNKLRLSEAARLLSEKNECSIAEIAYSVGYNNVSYFNRLFKREYGCTPKAFKAIYRKRE